MCMEISMVLHSSGCRDQTVQHQKSNPRYKLGKNAFEDLKAGCGWLLLHAHLQLSFTQKEPFLPPADSGAEGRRSGGPHSTTLLVSWGLLGHPSGTHFCSGAADMQSLIPWSPYPLISLAKALHCIWSDCNF